MAKISKKQSKDKIDQFESIDEFKEENLANKRAKVIFVGVKKIRIWQIMDLVKNN